MRSSPRASGPKPSGSRTRRRRSGSTCRGIPTRRSRRSSRRSSGSRCPTCSRSKEPVLIAGIVTAIRMQTPAAARWRSSRSTTAADRPRSSCTTRSSMPRATCCARTSSSSSRPRSRSATATTDRRRACASSPRPSTTSRRSASATRRVCASRATAAPTPRGSPRCSTPFRNGSCPIVVEYRNGGVGGELELPDAWRVNLEDPLLARLKDWLAPENVRVVY